MTGRYTGLYAFPESVAAARRLAEALELPCHVAEVHRFPDGESLVRLPQPVERAILFRALDRPNDKLVELMLAASVLRRQGAAELCLVAPYLAYMRQDAVFRPGEPVSQSVVGAWLARDFDRIVCVEPHLHRTGQLADVFPGRAADALSAVPVIAAGLRAAAVPPDTVILGPDEEAAPLAAGVAGALGLDVAVGTKERRGDRDVTVVLPAGPPLEGRPVVVVDDVVSSGETVFSCAAAARARGAAAVRAAVVHALFGAEVGERFRVAAIPVLSCDGVPHPTNALGLAPLLAETLRR
ncbi:ribose-phosphate diphosphokinase [Azospirillum sp. A39]|uniref:ribose-phosphate diphosphokinase n=1 Tax=Azospirillum sp. A39 TaxID=3462279 RepID=UPI0040461DCC